MRIEKKDKNFVYMKVKIRFPTSLYEAPVCFALNIILSGFFLLLKKRPGNKTVLGIFQLANN